MKKTMTISMLLLSAGLAVASPAHQHGVARMQVAVEGGSMEIDFSAPLESLVGFEHAPRNDKERKAMAALKDSFSRPQALLAPTAAAGCTAGPAALQIPDGEKHGRDHEHADLEAAISFRCTQPAALKDIELKMFDAFPRLQKVQVQLAAPGRQAGASLDRQRRSLRW